MQRILVAVFESRSQADAARAALLEQGFHDRQIAVEGGDPDADRARNRGAAGDAADVNPATSTGSEARGLAGVIARMFSGFGAQPDPHGHDYADIVARGGCLLALHALDDAAVTRATTLLLAHGARDVQPQGTPLQNGTPAAARDARAAREIASVSSVGGPQAYALPNAPTGWNHTGGGASTQRMREDPARPQGELSGTDDLGAEADRDLLERRKAERARKARR